MATAEREGYWTPLEKQTRDYLLLPVTLPLKLIPYAANILTFGGFLILFYAIYDFYLTRNFERQIWLLGLAWLTDLFDGPTARNNNNVTAIGTAADHIRDYCISFWMVVLAFHITGNTPELWPVYWILGLTIVGLVGVVTHTIIYQREKRKEKKTDTYRSFVKSFLLNDLVTSITARIHTVVLAVGGVSYIAGVTWGNFYTRLGMVLLLLQLFILGFYMHEIFQIQYEDRARKMQEARQRRIKKLTEIIVRLQEGKDGV